MPLTYEVDTKLKGLAPVLDEHAEWFGLVMRYLFFAEQRGVMKAPKQPDTFKVWLKESQDEESVEKVTLEGAKRLYDELHQMAVTLMTQASAGKKLEFKQFDTFINLFDDFVFNVRRLEQDYVLSDSGLDSATGLRNRKAMNVDMERELERRARRGKPFCLVLTRIDDYEQLKAIMTEERHREIIAISARLIKKCIRSFDDAYRSGEGEFVMSLKHTEPAGGVAAIARLRRYLEEENVEIDDGKGRTFKLTMSYCVAEPLPGDKVEDLLDNMRLDLKRYNDGRDTSMEYFEQSPLTRFVKDMGNQE